MNTQKQAMSKIAQIQKDDKVELSEAQKLELGEIEDFINKKKQEADNLWNDVNGYAANARDVSQGISIAERYYKEAKDAYEKFKNSERGYKSALSDVDAFYNRIKVDGFKFAIMNGFELHFDEIFAELSSKNIDCILLPSVSTFDSYERWKSLILSRAFVHNCYILRANRIGSYADKDFDWKFYGDSLLASPNGELLEHLGNKEELMIVDMSHTDVISSRRSWGFKETVRKRES